MDVRLLMAGEQGLVVEFGDAIDLALNALVHAFVRKLAASRIAGILEIVPTYRSALIVFDPFVIARDKLKTRLRALISETETAAAAPARKRLVRIPVRYGGEFGPDLDFVAKHNYITPDDVVRIHCARPYRIYMLGFMPGFPYLGGIDERISAPRLPQPRTKIPAGSVGIAGNQTGFYPYESPGGWRLIGRTPFQPFNPASPEPFLYSAGDYLQFFSIASDDFDHITRDVAARRYTPEIAELEPDA